VQAIDQAEFKDEVANYDNLHKIHTPTQQNISSQSKSVQTVSKN